MQKSSVFSLFLGSALSFASYADISRSAFIDQLDSANCSQVPPEIFLDTDTRHYDAANALSLSWITKTALEENRISAEEFEQHWQLSNLEIIDNLQYGLRVLISDYHDTTLVTFHHEAIDTRATNSAASYSNANRDMSFSLGEATHPVASLLKEEWDIILSSVISRAQKNSKLWVFGHELGGTFAQLSAVGFETEGLFVDQVYLYNSPAAGSPAWQAAANSLLNGRMYNESMGNSPLCSLVSALENE